MVSHPKVCPETTLTVSVEVAVRVLSNVTLLHCLSAIARTGGDELAPWIFLLKDRHHCVDVQLDVVVVVEFIVRVTLTPDTKTISLHS